MIREIKIKKYRNIGIDKEENLIINRFDEKMKLGGLIAIIGQNNTGKSNVLNAINQFGKKTYSGIDSFELICTFITDKREISLKRSSTGRCDCKTTYLNDGDEIDEEYSFNDSLDNKLFSNLKEMSIYEYNERDFVNFTCNDFKINIKRASKSQLLKSLLYGNQLYDELLKLDFEDKKKVKKFISDFNLYIEKRMRNFNNVFFDNQQQYYIVMSWDDDYLYLILKDKDDVISNFDEQSIGFKWFFKFYFCLFQRYEYKNGDILLIDEPAVNLHIASIIQLQSVLRDFATRNGLTIIFCTHSPFLLSASFLDEIRIVSKEKSIASINNFFYSLNSNDSDMIRYVEDAITSERKLLIENNCKYIFVESVDDYIVLSYFNEKIGHTKEFCFMPFNGYHKDPNKLLEQISLIQKNSVLLLNDSQFSKYISTINKDNRIVLFKEYLKEDLKKFLGKDYYNIINDRYNFDKKIDGFKLVQELFSRLLSIM